MTDQNFIKATQNWLDSFIIHYNICPFAQRERQKASIRFRIADTADTPLVLETLIQECEWLDAHPKTATTLLILPYGFNHFDDYLDLLEIAEQLLKMQNYEGIYQLASFHPDYCFEMSKNNEDDAANYTNRSPYPMFHVIREASLERALAGYSNPENIPARNIKLTRELGVETLQTLLQACYE